MKEIAKDKLSDYERIKYIVGDFTQMELNTKYDVILSSLALHHIPTDEQKEALSKVEAVLVDRDYLQIYDNLERMEENRNGVALHHNYFYHAWKTFSVSPFANAVVFTTETVSGITELVAKWYNETMNSTESTPQDYRILREFVEGTEGTGVFVQLPYNVEPVGSVGSDLSNFVLRTEIISDELNVIDVKVNDNNSIVLVRNENVSTATTGFTTFKIIAESGNVKNEQVVRVRVVS
jgi:predicted NodU family carbamoyl transferase